MKRLSIIIPVYNNKYVYRALNSIRKTESVEIIVIDGKSNIETLEVLNKYKSKIDLMISEKDKGLYDAMNKGISKASGEWIFTLASDDLLICNPIDIINKYEKLDTDLICGSLIAKDFKERFFTITPRIDRLELECSICHPSTFFRKDVYEKNGMYDLQYRCAADHEMFLRLFKHGCKISIIPEIITLFAYGGISTTNPGRAFLEDLRISDKYGVSKTASRKNFLIRVLKHYGSRIKDKLKVKHNTSFMNQEDLLLFLNGHPEVIREIITEE